MKQIEKQTIKSYSFLWNKECKKRVKPEKTHFEIVQGVLDKPIVQNNIGLEVGCGPGYDIEYMANRFPDKKFIAIDFNKSIYTVSKCLKKLHNVKFVRASAMNLPFKESVFDFVYSFGVLHHTVNPSVGMKEINKVLTKNSSLVTYLYENHEDNKIKYYSLKFITLIRKITTILPNKILYMACVIFSPLVYLLFTLPSKIFDKVESLKFLAKKMPFNFGRHPFDLIGDLFDRLQTPIEIRYGKEELKTVLGKTKFGNIKLAKIPDTAGWVVTAEKM